MKARSCTTALINVVDYLRLTLYDNYIAFLFPLDHTKAFDTVDQKVLLRKLHTLMHFSNSACSLMNILQLVYLNGNISNSLNVGKGIAQGSILGPILSVYLSTTYLMSWIIVA